MPDSIQVSSKCWETAAANAWVAETREAGRKRRQPNYHHDPYTKANIAIYPAENGNKAAVSKFSKDVGYIQCT